MYTSTASFSLWCILLHLIFHCIGTHITDEQKQKHRVRCVHCSFIITIVCFLDAASAAVLVELHAVAVFFFFNENAYVDYVRASAFALQYAESIHLSSLRMMFIDGDEDDAAYILKLQICTTFSYI